MVEEIGGGIPITDDISPNTREYFPTYYEWLLKDGVQIFLDRQQSGAATNTIYTVPQNHEFYLTHVSFAMHTTATGVGVVRANTSANLTFLSYLYLQSNTGLADSKSFNPPIKLRYGDLIEINTPLGSNANVFLHGVLVKKPVS